VFPCSKGEGKDSKTPKGKGKGREPVLFSQVQEKEGNGGVTAQRSQEGEKRGKEASPSVASSILKKKRRGKRSTSGVPPRLK